MASISTKKRKSGTKYYITYRIPDEAGTPRQIWFPCENKKEAHYLLDEVAEAENAGVEYRRPMPSQTYVASKTPIYNESMTITELMDKYVASKCAGGWEASTLRTSRGTINNYINPFIGDIAVAAITPQFIQEYYNDLPNHKAAKGNHRNTPDKNVSPRTVREVHKILRPAFNMAAVMGIIGTNPTLPVNLPKQPKYKREQWTEEEVGYALSLCKDIHLRLFIGIMFGCTLRSGELSGLTWDCVDVSEEAIASGKASIQISKTVRRLKKKDMKLTNNRNIIFAFPNLKANADSTTVLKGPKTDESVRRIFLPTSIARLLVDCKKIQAQEKIEWGDIYQDYGFDFVFAQPNGRPYDVKMLGIRFKRFVKENGLREVDGYSLRHSGSTAKLRATGNIKAVQGDMGHASAEMLTKVYAAIVDEDRKNNAVLIEERVFSKLANDKDKSTSIESAAK